MNKAGSGTPLSIYWIDVEGGASTILAAPNGQTIVVDAGFQGRAMRGASPKFSRTRCTRSRSTI